MAAYPTLEAAHTAGHKALAHHLSATLQANGLTLSHVQALHVVAGLHGLPNWNTLHARPATPRLSLEAARPQVQGSLQRRGLPVSSALLDQLCALPTPVNFTVHEQQITDVPAHTKVSESLILTGQVDEPALRQVLHGEFQRLSQLQGFTYRPHPESVFLWAFLSEAQAASNAGLFAGRLKRSVDDFRNGVAPQLTIQSSVLQASRAHLAYRFGLAPETRVAAFLDVCRAENRARILADQQYPNPQEFRPHQRHMMALRETWLTEIAQAHQISVDDLHAIMGEGLSLHWPMDSLSATHVHCLNLSALEKRPAERERSLSSLT